MKHLLLALVLTFLIVGGALAAIDYGNLSVKAENTEDIAGGASIYRFGYVNNTGLRIEEGFTKTTNAGTYTVSNVTFSFSGGSNLRDFVYPNANPVSDESTAFLHYDSTGSYGTSDPWNYHMLFFDERVGGNQFWTNGNAAVTSDGGSVTFRIQYDVTLPNGSTQSVNKTAQQSNSGQKAHFHTYLMVKWLDENGNEIADPLTDTEKESYYANITVNGNTNGRTADGRYCDANLYYWASYGLNLATSFKSPLTPVDKWWVIYPEPSGQDRMGLWVKKDTETYSVTQHNLPSGWTNVSGVGSNFSANLPSTPHGDTDFGIGDYMMHAFYPGYYHQVDQSPEALSPPPALLGQASDKWSVHYIVNQKDSDDTYDWGDLPDTGPGTGPGNYETLSSDNGPSHVIDPNIYMGYSTVDDEADGQPTSGADGDDNNGTTPDDEDGPQSSLTFTEGEYALVTIAATNNTGSAATLYGFIDWNGDGDFNDMHETASVTVPNGSNGAQVKLNFDTVPTNAPSTSYARFRLSTDAAAASPTGSASDGEVEDFPITINDISTPTPIESSSCLGALMSDVVSTDPPTSFPDPAAVGAINGRDNAFNVSVGGDFYVAGTGGTPVGGAEAEGRVLVLGDLVINRVGDKTYSMGFVGAGSGIIPDAYTDHVTVGGDVYVNAHDHPSPGTDGTRISLGSGLVPAGGDPVFGNIRYKGTLYKAGGAAPAMDGDFPDPVDVASLSQVINDMSLDMTPYSNPFTDLEALSSCWASFPQSENVSITSGASLITISSTNGASGLYVINITSDYFDGSNGNSIQFSNFPDDATILFNMNQAGSGETFNFNMTGSWSGLSQALRLRILWHFPDAATVNFTGSELWGSVYVANSNSTTTFGTVSINGRVAVAGDLRHEGSDGSEFHNYPFQGELPCECGTGDYDWGDNPDTGNGTGTGNYLTLSSNNGPRHEIVPGLYLGSAIDAEVDGQPTTDADGDDNNGTPDDEDGVIVADLTMAEGSSAAVRVNATNTTGGTALLVGFIDFNKDGDFGDAGERVITTVPDGSNNAQFTLNFTVPAGSAGTTYARFRLSRSAVASLEYGECFDGEVEDYKVTINGTLDWGDLPDTDAGTGPGNYQTLLSDNGPQHQIVSGLRMGAAVDAEPDGFNTVNADGDDNNGVDDEDGVVIADLNFVEGQPATVRVNTTNTTGAAATLYGFVDWNKDGDFQDTGETASVAVPTGSNNVEFTLNFGTVPQGTAGATYARFRLSTDPAAANAFGAATDGEVEDYPANILDEGSLDFGDLPDTGTGIGPGNYETLLANNGPRHGILAGLRMGAVVDAEADGFNTANADGDDLNNSDDEDGVFLADLTMSEGSPAKVRVTVTNTTGNAATLYGFIDFNNNGSFADANETASAAVPTGSNNAVVTLDFGAVPSGAVGTRYARFRLSTDASAAQPTGLALDGEVEDYKVIVLEEDGLDWGDNPDTGVGIGQGNYNTLANDFGPRHAITPATLRMGALVDAELNGFSSVNADGDDLDNLDDEDGVVMPAQLALNSQPGISVRVLNTTGQTAILTGWIDYNRNGEFEISERASVSVPNNTDGYVVLNFPNSGNTPGVTYARFRLSTQDENADGHLEPTGALSDGEVEDYMVELIENVGNIDFGDAPTSYGFAGHSSLNNNLQMRPDGGVNVDGEALSYYSANAHGDNIFDGSNDENGVASFPPLKSDNTTYTVNVDVFNNSGSDAVLVAWIDFDGDGIFSAGEGVLVTVPTSSNVQNVAVTWNGLSGLATGSTFARFRLAPSGSGLNTDTPTGIVNGGEVEDYPLNIENPIAIDLSSFQALITDEGIRVMWTVVSDVDVAGYHIYRSVSEFGEYNRVTETLIATEQSGQYEFMDRSSNHVSYYKLQEVSLDGTATYYGPIVATAMTEIDETVELPTEFNLAQNYPNPFNPVTTISYALPTAAEVTIVIYNIQGKAIRHLVTGQQAAGEYRIVWDAKDDVGNAVPTGLYIYRMHAGDYTHTLKMTLLK